MHKKEKRNTMSFHARAKKEIKRILAGLTNKNACSPACVRLDAPTTTAQ